MGLREPLGTFADEVDVRTFFKDQARGVDGVAQVLDARNAAGSHAAAVHEERVELDPTVGGEKAATTGVEGGIVLKDGDGGFNGVNGRAAACEDFMTDFEGPANAGFVCRCGVGGNGPCASVNKEGWIVRG